MNPGELAKRLFEQADKLMLKASYLRTLCDHKFVILQTWEYEPGLWLEQRECSICKLFETGKKEL